MREHQMMMMMMVMMTMLVDHHSLTGHARDEVERELPGAVGVGDLLG